MIELCHSEAIRSSPFFNIFANLNPGLFTIDEARELIERSLAGAAVRFEEDIVQLIFRSLFNCWLQQRQPIVHVEDVNALLGEVVERGLAVLKHVWEDATPGEKAVMAGLAAANSRRPHPAGLAEIDRG